MSSKQLPVMNVFTIDTEDWYHANYEDGLFSNSSSPSSTVEANTEVYLKLFEQYHCTATFFVLGVVAQQHPQLVQRISEAGHEIASHGYGHQLVYRQTPAEFREDVHKSKTILEDLIGKPVLGYRAPSWSITEKSLWALKILSQEGFEYDSSIFPFANFLYGIRGAPRFPYCSRYYQENTDLLEVPPSTVHTPLLNIPFSGGFYFRAMPTSVIKIMTRILNHQGHPVIFYLHPREIDPSQPRLRLQMRDALIHYCGIRGCKYKLERILRQYPCQSVEQYRAVIGHRFQDAPRH